MASNSKKSVNFSGQKHSMNIDVLNSVIGGPKTPSSTKNSNRKISKTFRQYEIRRPSLRKKSALICKPK